MTVAIIGVAAGAVVLSMPDPRPSAADQAERFAAGLVRAREEAILTNRPVAVIADRAGYDFTQFDGEAWSPLNGVFRDHDWDDGVTAPNEVIRIVFDPTGIAEPARVRLAKDGQSLTVSVDGAGEVRIDE